MIELKGMSKETKALVVYFLLLISLSSFVVTGILVSKNQALHFAQFYMFTPGVAAIITRFFFYGPRFSDAYLGLGRARHWIRFWVASITLAILSYLVFSLLGAVTWDFTREVFLAGLAKQFELPVQKIEGALPWGLTPHDVLLLFTAGNFTLFNLLPGLIVGMGEELGHRGLMFKMMAKKNVLAAIIFGGLVSFLWHLPLSLSLKEMSTFNTFEITINTFVLCIGSIFTHIYLAFVLIKTHSTWITALAHITFNNVSSALGFFVIVKDQTMANIGLTLTMVIAVVIGFWKFDFFDVLDSEEQDTAASVKHLAHKN